jgi:hypothetical protein
MFQNFEKTSYLSMFKTISNPKNFNLQNKVPKVGNPSAIIMVISSWLFAKTLNSQKIAGTKLPKLDNINFSWYGYVVSCYRHRIYIQYVYYAVIVRLFVRFINKFSQTRIRM